MRAAVNDVHHRYRHLNGTHAAEVAEKRKPRLLGCGPRHGHRNRENGVGAETALVFRTVKFNHRAVDKGLIASFTAENGVGDFAVHVLNGL